MKILLRSLLIMLILLLAGLAWFSRPDAIDLSRKHQKLLERMPDDHEGRNAFEFRRLRDPNTGRIPDNIEKLEREFARTIPKVSDPGLFRPAQAQLATWTSRGPWNIGGRTRALGVDIRNKNIILAGGVSGGMWRSTNGGSSWVKTTDPAELHSVTCLVQDTRSGHQDTWYYGSGENRGNSASGEGGSATYSGNGLFKSNDNGQTWSVLATTATNDPQTTWANDYIWNVAIDPSNTAQNEVYFAYYGSIKRSTNGGSSFTRYLNGSTLSRFTDVAVSSTGVVYATLSSDGDNPGIFRSPDGTNWTDITPAGFPGEYRRIVIGIAPSNENVVYFLGDTPGSGTNDHSLWKYTYVSGDGSGAGGTWADRSANLPNEGGSVGNFDSQDSYNLICKVKPDDEDVVFFGGTNLYRTNNGLATGGIFNPVTNPGADLHWIGGYSINNDVSITANHYVDQHAIVFDPTDPDILLSGNDGGVYRTNNNMAYPISWTRLNNGYLTSQFYAIGIDHATSGSPLIIGGMQDNSTFVTQSTSPTASWEILTGGDGCFCGVDDGGLHWYSSWQNGGIFRDDFASNGSYLGWAKIDPLNASGNDYLFVTPFALDPANTDRMYLLEGNWLWYNSDLTAIARTSWGSNTNWTKLTNTDQGHTVTAVGVSKTTEHRVFYGTSNGRVYRLDNAPTNPTPVNISTGLPAGYVACICVDPHDGEKVMAVFSNYSIPSIYYSTNAGATWESVSGNLEQNPDGSGNGPSCRWADILYVNGTPVYFVGTSEGLYSTWTLNGLGTFWAQEGPSTIGNVVVDMIRSREADRLVVVGTHGQGVFSSTINTSVDVVDAGPAGFVLEQNYPNPFNPSTTIRYSLPQAGQVSLNIYDATGREVERLVKGHQEAGTYTATFDGSRLASGLYIARIQAGDHSAVRKMTLIK